MLLAASRRSRRRVRGGGRRPRHDRSEVVVGLRPISIAWGEKLGQHASQAKNVGPRARSFALGDLWGDVSDGAHDRARSCHAVAVGERRQHAVPVDLVVLERLGQAPIQDDGLAERSNQDVRGLEVSMHDGVLVRIRDRLTRPTDARHERESLGTRPRRCDRLVERISLDQTHREVPASIREEPRVVSRNDGGVLKAGGQRHLAFEAKCGALVFGPRTHALERHPAAENCVERFEHLAHPASADLLADHVAFGARACVLVFCPTQRRDESQARRAAIDMGVCPSAFGGGQLPGEQRHHRGFAQAVRSSRRRR